MAICSPATVRDNWGLLGPHWASARFTGLVADTLRALATQQMAAPCEQIGQRTGHEEAMRILLQPAVAHLGKAKHPLDDPNHMFSPGPHFGLGAVFRPLDLIDNTAVAVATIGEISSFGRALPGLPPAGRGKPDHPIPGSPCRAADRPPPAIGVIGRRVVTAVDQPGRHRRRYAPSSRSATGCPSWSDASRGRAPSPRSSSSSAPR